jgi:hypothetical protein
VLFSFLRAVLTAIPADQVVQFAWFGQPYFLPTAIPEYFAARISIARERS